MENKHNKFNAVGTSRGLAAVALVAALMFSLVLAACGDSTTAGTTSSTTAPVAATTSSTSATSGTTTTVAGSPTTSSSTTVSGTTAAAGSSSTTRTGTTVAGTPTTASSSTTTVAGSPTTSSSTTVSGTTSTGSSSTSPAITGATQINATGAGVTDISNQLKAAGITATDAKFYYSENETEALTTAADTAYTGAGYAFGVPTFSKPLVLPGTSNALGFYTKSGSPDVLVLIAPIPTEASQVDTNFLIPGLSQETRTSIVNNLKGHKTAIAVLSGQNLSTSVLALIQKAAGSMSGGGSMTVAPTPTK